MKIDEKIENDKNYWMFTYDFKDKKIESIFDKESKPVLAKKDKKNQLIVILYLLCVLIFIYANMLLSQILFLILN